MTDKASTAPAAGSHKLPRNRVYKSAVARRRHAVNDAELWNSVHVVGSPVCVHRDNGEILATKTRSEADVLGDTAVVWVDGISGAYALFRIHDLETSAASALKAPTESVSPTASPASAETTPVSVAAGARKEEP